MEAQFDPFRESANLDADRRPVCDKRTRGSEIVLDVPRGTPRCVGHVESHFDPSGHGVSVGAR